MHGKRKDLSSHSKRNLVSRAFFVAQQDTLLEVQPLRTCYVILRTAYVRRQNRPKRGKAELFSGPISDSEIMMGKRVTSAMCRHEVFVVKKRSSK